MKEKLSILGLAALLASPLALFSGCGSDQVSFETQEDSRRQAIENAEYNARNWRNTNAPNHKIIMRGDSSINSSCAQGDGWASVDLNSDAGEKIELKCSTVSGTIGCLTKTDFQAREYAQEEGKCNPEVPFPLPKIEK